MDKINNINGVVSILRSQVTKKLAEKSKNSQTKKGDKKISAERINVAELEKQVIERITELNQESSDYKQRSMRVIIESIVLWEFGGKILNDPEVESFVDNVINNMSASKNIADIVDEFIEGVSTRDEL